MLREDDNWEKLTIGLLIATLFIVGFNAYQMYRFYGGAKDTAGNENQEAVMSGNAVSESTLAEKGPDVIPKGIPEIYGKELGVSFDDVSPSNPQKADSTIKKLATLDQKISLTGKNLERYIAAAGQISCEYCCGAEAIITKDGQAACSCSHSFAMRGLTKYLIKNHENEYTNDEILEELGKWKTLFFPSKITEKAGVLKEKGIELNYINLASNKYRGIEKDAAKGAAGEMVGGC